MSPIVLTRDHGLVVISAAAIAFQVLMIGFIAGGRRGKVFNKQFLDKNFGEQHHIEIGEAITKGGYPDMGNGRYAEKLTYKEWFEFNIAQRAHYNFIEHVASVLILIILAGIAYPKPAGWLGWGYFIGRLFYTIGYIRRGPKGRTLGALIVDLSLLGLIILAFMSGGKIFNM